MIHWSINNTQVSGPMNDLQTLVMNYQKVWNAKECTLENLMGSVEESYAKLVRYFIVQYCYNMGKTNTGSTFFIERNDENRFKYFFMALEQCVRGFRNVMRPLILVDSTTFKARYERKLIIAICQDTNIQIYRLTFSIVDGENNRALHWFFTKLKKVIGDIKNLAFIIDRGQSIINGIVKVFLEAHHDYYMYHIQGNLKSKYRGKGIIVLFRRAAKTYRFEEFKKFMVEIDNKSHAAWEYLTGIRIEHWWFNNRREKSQSCTSVLTLAREDKLFKTLDVARKVFIEPLDQFRFSVRYVRNFGYIVDLNGSTCMCRQFQLESFPCAHAVAVAMYRGFPPHTLCSVYYTTDYWTASYAEIIFPIPNEIEWEVPDHILSLNNLLPPEVGPRTPGSRRTSIIPSTAEFFRPRKCVIEAIDVVDDFQVKKVDRSLLVVIPYHGLKDVY
ncbi:uncharacterized protein LOC111373571 [Olea europaea var. sylvestris]|uniref:uncharacterized protein LOC111373571 n=1 Tax=Olea europaea var. sylvestris TaxID=158386 RepID=UPI000C1D4937|nr:uncharacterized protein LOC111373571 [Olea europaea var. sylvestris]